MLWLLVVPQKFYDTNNKKGRSSMHLLMIAEHFYPAQLGGPANTLYWLSQALVENTVSVTCITTKKKIPKDFLESTHNWVYLKGIKIFYCKARTKIPISVIVKGFGELRHCDLILFSSVCFLPNFILALWAKLHKKPIIWSPRGELSQAAIGKSRVKRFYFKVLNCLFASSVVFHATSSEEKERINLFFPNKKNVLVIPNYFILPDIKYNLSTKKYFLYLGRIAPIKALDNLFKGLALSTSFKNSDYLLYVVGPDQHNYKSYLVSLSKKLGIENRVVFNGTVNDEEKFRLFAQAYFSVLVSHSENFGNVVIESLSQGTPVITSKGTPWQVLETSKAGLWIPNSPEQIGQAFDMVLNISSESYLEMRKNALMLSKEYDVRNNIQSWISAFQSCRI